MIYFTIAFVVEKAHFNGCLITDTDSTYFSGKSVQ
jgi:hypothetical protein